jgi:hypothetical protein
MINSMIFMIIFLMNVILCFVVAHVADQKNRSAIGFFFLSFVFSFLVGILVILAMPAKPRSNRVIGGISMGKLGQSNCPHCQASVIEGAVLCKNCKTSIAAPVIQDKFSTEVQGAYQRAYSRSSSKKKR